MKRTAGIYKTGLIGFFDILGYRELIQWNDLRTCAAIIENIVFTTV
jgi:hypothetical protein